MPDSYSGDNDFISKITDIVEENISNEQFGVSELAREIGMSRSNLLRKLKKITKLSVSQFIRQVRLRHAMEMLRLKSLTVSEVTYKVGFGSPSYFIKCFHDYYGYPPGEVGNREANDSGLTRLSPPKKNKWIVILGIVLSILLLGAILFIIFKPVSLIQSDLEKSIAVLPFKNDSNDSTNVYIINGLMESILTNLQNIEDLRVISRTSVEKYRTNPKSIPEIAKELNANYLVEGSGQKIGNKILLNIQLIEAETDRHLWAEQYNREVTDIFDLQKEVAKNIANKIEAIITPEEEERIDKAPTDDLVAYDYFLKGLDLLNKSTLKDVKESIPYFAKAIDQDNEYARAYAAIAIAYYMLDDNQTEKIYADSINNYADKALLYDSQLPQSLIAKGLFYMQNEEYELAVSYFEKVLEYNPNSDLVFIFLVDLYVNHIPDTEKYLEYALRGIEIDIAAYDSITASYSFLHISNAFIQNGFIREAEHYINKSLEYFPGNLFSQYVKAFILYARNRDLNQTKVLLIETLNKDSTRYDILQEVGKICYYQRDYDGAYFYYKKYLNIKEALHLDIYKSENAKIGVVLSELGYEEDSQKFFEEYKNYAEKDKSIYKHMNMALYYSYRGDNANAMEQLEMFSHENNYHYWTLIFVPIDPLIDSIKDLPEFKQIWDELEIKFWNNHDRIQASLEEKGLI